MKTTRLRDAEGVAALIETLDVELAQALGTAADVVVVGVRRGGIALAARLVERLRRRGLRVDTGTVDIALYRDDALLAWPRPEVGRTDIAAPLDGRQVVLVDDVFWTGRTARAAIDAVLDFGRPARLWFVALASRPGRELPVVPDLVAVQLTAPQTARIELRMTEDGHAGDELVLVEFDA